MKVLLDMNVSPDLVGPLVDAGYEASHWSVPGEIHASDGEIVAHARAHGFTIITHDLDFGIMLVASGDSKPSVVQVRIADLLSPALAQHVIFALRHAEEELIDGALVTIDPNKVRIRRLSIESIE